MAQKERKDIKELLDEVKDLVLTYEHEIELLEKVAQEEDDPDQKGPTLGEVFGQGDVVNVYGLELPNFLEALWDRPIKFKDMARPARRIQRLKDAIEGHLGNIQQAVEDVKTRSQRMAKTAVRKSPKGTERVRAFQQHRMLQSLDLFSVGEPLNRIRFTRGGTLITVGVYLPVADMGELGITESSEDADSDNTLADRLISNAMKEYASDVLDHTQSIVMTIGATLGHDRVERQLHMVGYSLMPDGVEVAKEMLQIGLRQPAEVGFYRYSGGETVDKIVGDAIELPQPDDHIRVQATLTYTFRSSRNRIDDLLTELNMLPDMAVFRGLVPLSDSNEEETVDEAIEVLFEDENEETVSAPEHAGVVHKTLQKAVQEQHPEEEPEPEVIPTQEDLEQEAEQAGIELVEPEEAPAEDKTPDPLDPEVQAKFRALFTEEPTGETADETPEEAASESTAESQQDDDDDVVFEFEF